MDAYTDEEVECCFEEFYEDVHTEFLKFGEIVNFKVCKNGSFHLRGNVYVQYKLLDSAVLAYNSVNGRYFAGKQVSCNFVNLTRWKVAICGEFMKSRYKTCSHGTACNFIHCFRNPGGDYEWADSDKPPPKYWVKNMIALFGYSDDYDETLRKHGNSSVLKNSSNVPKTDSDRYHSRRSRSREMDQSSSGRSCRRKWKDERTERTPPDEEWNTDFKDNHKRKCRHRTPDTYSDGEKHHERSTRKSSFKMNKDNESRSHEEYSDVDWDTTTREVEKQHGREGRNSRKRNKDHMDRIYETGSDGDRHRKKHHNNQRKRSRHRSRDVCNLTDESDSDKDRTEMETQRDYSRKSSRHRRSRLQDYCKDSENENYKVDGELDSTHGNTKNVSHESCGELSRKNSRGDRHHKSKDSDNHL